MAATEVDLSLANSKCVEFFQALATQGKAFNFSLNMGTNFSISLDTRSKALAPQPVLKKQGKPLNTEKKWQAQNGNFIFLYSNY